MEDKSQYLQDLNQIRSMMERSSRFISLSGVSGVFAGIYALIGAWWANRIVVNKIGSLYEQQILKLPNSLTIQLLIIAIVVLVLALGTGIFFTTRKAKQQGIATWDKSAKLLIINLLIPLVTGGLFCLILIDQGWVGLIAPLTLIFYGLALINASKYTFNDVRYLGISEIILGLVSTYYIGYGIYFWAVGFGVLHILYGAIMYFKYER